MITISDGILNIPEGERFIGHSYDNLHTQKKFFIRSNPESGWLYRLYLTFDDGRHNFFMLPATVSNEGTLLTWNIEESHILKSGLIKAQIKAFSEDKEVYHTTSDVFVAGRAAEEDEEFKNSNSEFLNFERTLNDLYLKMNTASAKMPYVGTNGNWFTYDINSESYVDSGVSSMIAVENGTLTPEKLDRAYWERLSLVHIQITDADDLFERVGFTNAGGSIAFVNVNMKVNVGEGTQKLETLNGFCYASGIKFANFDTVYLINVTDGSMWKINRFNEGTDTTPVYTYKYIRQQGEVAVDDALMLFSANPVQNKVITQKFMDIEDRIAGARDVYWRADSNRAGILNTGNLAEIITSHDWAPNKMYRLHFDSSGDWGLGGGASVGNPNLADHEVIAIPYGEQGLYILDMTTSKTYLYENGANDITPIENSTVVDAGEFSTLEKLQDYKFAKGKLYKFSLVEELRASTIDDANLCLGIYEYEMGPGGYLRFINLITGKCGGLWIYNGSYSEIGNNDSNNFVNAGTFHLLTDLQAYEFEKDVLYRFGLGGGLGSKDCLGIYMIVSGVGTDENIYRKLRFIDLLSGKTGELDITSGEYTEYGGVELNNDFINAGTFTTLDSFVAYPFEQGKSYRFYIPGSFSGAPVSEGQYIGSCSKIDAGEPLTLEFGNILPDSVGYFLNLDTGVLSGKYTADQTYNPNSENAQSGKAVSEAINAQLGNIETLLSQI